MWEMQAVNGAERTWGNAEGAVIWLDLGSNISCRDRYNRYKEYCTPTQALSEVHDPFSDVLDGDQEGEEPRGNQDTYWSEKDRHVIGPCQGLMKVSAACLRKLTSAVKANGDVGTSQHLAQLDDLADITKEISPK